MAGGEEFAFGVCGDELGDFFQKLGGGVLEGDFGLVLEGDELF